MRRNIATESSYRGTLVRPPKKTCGEKVKTFFWDKKAKTCLTRTPLNWISIFFFYILFLFGVFLLFHISMQFAKFLAAIHSNRPQYVLEDSPIGSSPGLNFFPMCGRSNLIWLSGNRSYQKYVNKINSEFQRYKTINESFSTSDLGSCGTPPFGYDQKTPCIFLRMNKLVLWKPKPYISKDTLPKDMPKSVKTQIKFSSSPLIWVTCMGSTPKDRDHITDEFFEFQGSKGFDPSPFPFDNQEGFVDPIVAIMLKDSQPKKLVYSFKCSAWSKDLNSDVASVEVPYYIE